MGLPTLKPSLRVTRTNKISFSLNNNNGLNATSEIQNDKNKISIIMNTDTNNNIEVTNASTFSFNPKAKILKKSQLDVAHLMTYSEKMVENLELPVPTLEKVEKSDKIISLKNRRTRLSQDMNKNSFNSSISSNLNVKLFQTELMKIKKEESNIKVSNDILKDNLHKMQEKVEFDPFKKQFLNDLKVLDKIKVDRSIYIFGNNMIKPKILKESENNIFQDSEKITKLSAAAAYYSKEMILEKFNIVQNNKNPNVINFKVKITREKVDELMSEIKSNDKFNVIQGMIGKMKKRERAFLTHHGS
jgi:hypothetical protein